MSKILSVVYSAHHASHGFGSYNHRCVLTQEQRIRYSDYGTDITVPKHSNLFFTSNYSRGLVDLNRSPEDPTLFPGKDFGRPNRNKIWIQGQEPTREERENFFKTIYKPYHDQLLTTICQLDKPGVVIAWDNTAHYDIGRNPDGSDRIMTPFILSNNGDKEKGDTSKKELLTCNPKFLKEFACEFRLALKKHGLPDEVHLNIYDDASNDECGYIANRYNTYRSGNSLNIAHSVEAFQIEYDTIITHDQITLTPNYDAMEKLRKAFEEAMEKAYANLLTWNIA